MEKLVVVIPNYNGEQYVKNCMNSLIPEGFPILIIDNASTDHSAEYMKETHPDIKLRLNTNGLSDLINGKPTAQLICGNIDAVSVSLNEFTSEKYDKITRNIFPGKAFDAMLRFTEDCVKYCDDVRMTVVDVISQVGIEFARKICESTGARFSVRKFVKEN